MKKLHIRLAASLMTLTASVAGFQVRADLLKELYIVNANQENLIDFKSDCKEYNLEVSSLTPVSVSAIPVDSRCTVTITRSSDTYYNHSVLEPLGNKTDFNVEVCRGSEKEVYAINIEANTNLSGDFRELSVYQIMVASFMHGADGAPGYNDLWGPEGHRTNGNLRGIIESLDYIQSLGMNAIWLTPIFDSTNGTGGEKLQATGYFCTDYFNIDPKFGTKDEFKELVDEAHNRGIYVILDGVFGHHGGVSKASPNGNTVKTVDSTPCVRPNQGEWGNIVFPESLDYFKEVVRYWMDEYGVDGWRLDQCYQVYQNGHNYWKDIREEVEKVGAERKARGEQWGTLGYMVGEDWASPSGITTTQLDGLRSVFDFEGRGTVLGSNTDALKTIYRPATERGYDAGVNPNLFLSNHDMERVGDIYNDADRLIYEHCILANYSGPVTVYYGDEFGDVSGNGNSDNKGRTSGHITANNTKEQTICDGVKALFTARRDNPAMWRGDYSMRESGGILELTKTDAETGNKIVTIFPTTSGSWTLTEAGQDLLSGRQVSGTITLSAWKPVVVKVK